MCTNIFGGSVPSSFVSITINNHWKVIQLMSLMLLLIAHLVTLKLFGGPAVLRTILISKCLYNLYVSTLLYAPMLGINLLQNNV